MIVDITAGRTADEERRKLILKLRQRSNDLDRILFIAAHDLRSPLFNIRGFTDQLEKGVEALRATLSEATLSDPTREKLAVLHTDIPEWLHFIKEGSRKMESLLSGLLRLSRIGAASLSPAVVNNLGKLISETLDAQQFRIREDNIDIVVEENLPDCRGDLTLITQVFANLIDNAIKYRHPDRPCKIRIHGSQENGRSIYRVVRWGEAPYPGRRSGTQSGISRGDALPNLVACVALAFGRVSVVSRGGLPGFPIDQGMSRRQVADLCDRDREVF
jgi:signal transduction histidine kinase